LTVGILTLADLITIPILAGMVAFYGSGQALFGPAFSSIVPSIVPKRSWSRRTRSGRWSGRSR